ncbi:MAG: lytic transglycosylase domain-containing protein [Bacteroidetes bacterium]|nr:lytic transglycosylase domain-containing protein [Bacteroidota bacterium]
MVKKLLFHHIGIVLFSVFCFQAFGQGQVQAPGEYTAVIKTSPSKASSIIADSVSKKDTIKEVQFTSDPKQGFKDLFVSNARVNGLNTAQLNPRAISFVQDYMEKHGKSLEKLKGWGKPYFDMMDKILELHGVPGEMKYLAVIESYLKSSAVSWVGAVGPWQFMPATGRGNGLRVDRFVDERTDYYKSTHAAAHYLTYLFNIYRDWLLVIAAYNGGPGNVDAAIRKSGSRDFWVLQNYLPAESRNHVKKFIATHYIMEGQGSETTLTQEEAINLKLNYARTQAAAATVSTPAADSIKTQFISGRYNSTVISQFTMMDIAEFNKLNPDFDNQIIDAGSYNLQLPKEKMSLFEANRVKILYESMQVMLKALNEPKKAF